MLAVLSGCGSVSGTGDASSAAETESAGEDLENVIVAGSSAGFFSATNLDPAEDWNGWYISFYGAGETLFRLDESYTANPWLVESYENVDERTWVFTLRDDVFFSNGEQMTGDAVAACFERTYEINARASETLPIESITADGQELTIVTSSADPAITSDLCDPLLTVYYVGEDEDYDTFTSCTGPFVVDSFTLNEEIVVVKNENYWGGTVNTDKAYLEIFDDSDALNMALQNGEVDIIVSAGANALRLFADDDNYQILSASTSRGNFIDFNYESSYGQDDVLREVIARAIDREGYAEVICSGASNANYGIYPDTMSFGDNEQLDIRITAQDLKGAEALLDEAGYTDTDGDGIREIDGEPISMTVVTISTTDAFVSLCDDLASALKSIGIELNIQLYEKLESREDYEGVTWDLCIENKSMSATGNASYFFDSTVVTGASGNYGGYSNPELDSLAAALKSAYDTDERNALVFEMEQMLLDDNSFIVFANQNFTCVTNNTISGFTVQPSEYYFLDAAITKE